MARRRFSPALSVYLAASRAAGAVAPWLLRRRLARGKEDAARIGERLGRAGLPRPAGRLVWLHAASVGEAVSALPLIDALGARSVAGCLLTTGTVTSARRIAGALPGHAFHQYAPVDTAGAVGRFLDHWRPDLAIWIESELWPRAIVDTARRGVPLALVNARISARSAARWARVPGMAASLLNAFSAIVTQDHETVRRIDMLGGRARFAGNLKACAPPPAADPGVLAELRAALGDRPAWLAASTHPGEEEIAVEAQRRLAAVSRTPPLLVLAPRHPARGDAIAAMLAAQGLDVARRSAGEKPGPGTDVLLADTLGEMGLWYRLAPVTFVGGSLAERGGHTPFEPVALGSAVLHGPHVANFAPAYRALGKADAALAIADAPTLAVGVRALLEEAAARAAMVRRARAVHDRLRPDVAALAERLIALMEGAG